MAVDQAREGLLVTGSQASQQFAFAGAERGIPPQIFRICRDREPHTRWSPGGRRRYTVTRPLRAGLSKCPAVPDDSGDLMSRFTDAELYLRGSETLLASWEAYARRGRKGER